MAAHRLLLASVGKRETPHEAQHSGGSDGVFTGKTPAAGRGRRDRERATRSGRQPGDAEPRPESAIGDSFPHTTPPRYSVNVRDLPPHVG